MESPKSLTGPVNLGNNSEMSMLDLATSLIVTTKSKSSKVSFESLPEDDPKQRQPSLERAKEMLQWQPKMSLTAGLERTVEYFRQVI